MVKRLIPLHEHGGTLTRRDGGVELSLARLAPLGMIAELSLLRQQHVNQLEIWDSAVDWTMRLTLSETQQANEPAIASWRRGGLDVRISRTELERWLSFFSTYYRDRRADVDHVDLEARLEGKQTATLDIMLKVVESKPPLGADDARHMLGLKTRRTRKVGPS
jgi:hypothetical protein